ncbi:MAG TPA: hypothetical protein VFP77_10595 [Gemmatimonadaceae bacterium]|nr:hypothetical protein [Gemmatimonadaceae bacterium]
MLVGALAAGCARFGFSNRALITAPSPSHELVFICHEIPELDGPGHVWRLETRDGGVLRQLFRGSDGSGHCDAATWSADGATLAIVERGTIHIADVAWAMAHPEEKKTHWFVRQFSYSTEDASLRVSNIRFASARELTFDISGQPTRLIIPSPLVPGRRT